MRSLVVVAAGLVSLAGALNGGQAKPIAPAEKTPLWNGKDFTGWKLFGRNPNADLCTVWSVKDGVIRCTGGVPGYIRTEADYANYKLHVEWRWVAVENEKGRPRRRRNSGVLLHMSLPDRVWPRSIECQLMEGNAGDFYVIGGTEFKEHKDLVAANLAKSKGKKKPRPTRRTPKKGQSSEKPIGEWNVYDIICKGNSIVPHVNGEKKNEATQTSVASGKICLQSEGAPIEFRNVYIAPVD